MSVQFRVLGPVEIVVEGETLVIPRRRERCLLAVLLLELRRVVPASRLAELLWDGEPPEGARRTLRSHVSRLRALLGAVGAADSGVELASVHGGYRMEADPTTIDAHCFRSLVSHAAAMDDPRDRVAHLRSALDLWRGPAMDNAASDWLRDRLCAHLEEERLSAIERFASDGLATGCTEVMPELARTVHAHPGHESLVALLMRAKHRAGRKVEALETYERTRAYLAEELGLDPSPELRELHQTILRDEGSAASSYSPGMLPPRVPQQLPAGVAGFTGRAAYLRQLDAMMPPASAPAAPAMLTVITGTAGIGKTALAVHWAWRAANRFPDGQIYVDMRGFDPDGAPVKPADAVRSLLEALDVAPERIPAEMGARVGLYRSLISGRRVLIVLDSVASSDHVRPLLPATAGCMVVVTSRNQLAGLIAAEGGQLVTLDLLGEDEARELLEQRLGAPRVAAEPEATVEIIDHCARLPLALTVVAARAAVRPEFPLCIVAEELRDAEARLDACSDPGTTADIRTVFSGSYEKLSAEAASVFRALGLAAGSDVSIAAAANLTGRTRADVRLRLTELTRYHVAKEQAPGRYSCHGLLRLYAVERSRAIDGEPYRRVALRRMLDYYLHSAHAAAMIIHPHRLPISLGEPHPDVVPETFVDRDALDWLLSERHVLVASVEQAATSGFLDHAWQLSWALLDVITRQGDWSSWERAHRTALEAVHLRVDPLAQAIAHGCMARFKLVTGDHEEALTHMQSSLDRLRVVGDPTRQARAQISLGVGLLRQGRHAEAIRSVEDGWRSCRAESDVSGQAKAMLAMGWIHAEVGDHEQSLRYCRQALDSMQEIGDPVNQTLAWKGVGQALHNLEQYRQAVTCYERALSLARDQRDHNAEAAVLTRLAEAYSATGDRDADRRARRSALVICERFGRAQLAWPGWRSTGDLTS